MTKGHLFIATSVLLFIGCNTKTSDNRNNQVELTSDTISINPDKQVNCFIYHRFGDSRYPSTNVSVKNFRAHLEYLKQAGFKVMNFSDAIGYMKNDQPVMKVAVITIDDGFSSFYENGLPLLEEFAFPATLFINTETVGGNSYMSWDELKDAGKRGVEIGNHTHSHAFFLDIDNEKRYDQFAAEIKTCQDLIKENLEFTPKVFAYPYGEFDARMKAIVQESGFIAGAAQNSGVINPNTNFMACPRFPMATGLDELGSFKLKANVKPLNITGEPENHIIMDDARPEMDLYLEQEGLRIDEMQCFIQGNQCNIEIETLSTDKYRLSITPSQNIHNRRRTLYTLTVPNSKNQWSWYSYLWIHPTVKE
ncbi:MAG: polysaccharide deacetylase family protein [Bacteroidota bacterium]